MQWENSSDYVLTLSETCSILPMSRLSELRALQVYNRCVPRGTSRESRSQGGYERRLPAAGSIVEQF